jgi:hypothetical protein
MFVLSLMVLAAIVVVRTFDLNYTLIGPAGTTSWCEDGDLYFMCIAGRTGCAPFCWDGRDLFLHGAGELLSIPPSHEPTWQGRRLGIGIAWSNRTPRYFLLSIRDWHAVLVLAAPALVTWLHRLIKRPAHREEIHKVQAYNPPP